MAENTKKRNNAYIFFIISIALIIFDQWTKLAVKGIHSFGLNLPGMHFGQIIPIIGDTLQVTYTENEGMAFGITFGPWKIILSLFSIIASGALSYYLIKLDQFSNWIKLGVAFILAGAVGNLVDRVFYGIIFHESPLFYGRVVDFLLLDIPDINIGSIHYTHWPVFNIADSCVTAGVVLLILFHKKIPPFEQLFSRFGRNNPPPDRAVDIPVKKEHELE